MNPSFKDLTNQVFERWAVIGRAENDKGSSARWLCECSCPARTRRVIGSYELTSRRSRSCGCIQREHQLTGKQFGRLTVLSRVDKRHWLCLCTCGETKVIQDSNLRAGTSQSCGCLRREIARGQIAVLRRDHPEIKSTFKHGHSPQSGNSPTYVSWLSVIQRCTNPTNKDWEHYGGAIPPVRVCDHWRSDFRNFLTDMGERLKGTTLGRFGDIGNYSCGHCDQCKQNGWELNCEWQTTREQKTEQKIKKQLQFLAVTGGAT